MKWEGKISELLNELAFLWPERANDLVVVPIYNLIYRRVDVQQIIS